MYVLPCICTSCLPPPDEACRNFSTNRPMQGQKRPMQEQKRPVKEQKKSTGKTDLQIDLCESKRKLRTAGYFSRHWVGSRSSRPMSLLTQVGLF